LKAGEKKMLIVTEEEKHRLASFLKRKGLQMDRLMAKGHSSRIFLVKRGKRSLIAKLEREDSPRKEMLDKEVKCLRKANALGIGPRLIGFDTINRVILMEFIDGPTFKDWLFEKKRAKEELSAFISGLLGQALLLDEAGIDHGQLAGPGKNILVRQGRPIIIDFEKASFRRKFHNHSTLVSFLFKSKHSAITKRVKEVLGEETEELKKGKKEN